MAKGKVPADRQAALTKPEIAIKKIDRVRTAGVRFGGVFADAGYGMSAPFRQTLSKRGLGGRRARPTEGLCGRCRDDSSGRGPRPAPSTPIPDSESVAAEALLAGQPWRRVSWRCSTKGRLAARFATLRVRVACGPAQRIREMGNQHLPGKEVWLAGEHRCKPPVGAALRRGGSSDEVALVQATVFASVSATVQ